jgi:thymidylate synthase
VQFNDTYFQADSLDDLMAELYLQLLAQPDKHKASRGIFTELFGPLLELTDPRARLSRSESRGKIFSALGELFWYLSGTNSYDFIQYYIPHAYEKESETDDNSVRNGYGIRLFNHNNKHDQIANVIKTLQNKQTSRRAVIQLFDASDLTGNFREIPCTCTLQFLVRNNKLNLLVNMRSNDAYRGLPHDIFAFTMLQELVARSLKDVDVGIYKHNAGSLHLYEEIQIGETKKNDHEAAQAFVDEGWQDKIAMPKMPLGDQWDAIKQVSVIEQQIRTGQAVDISQSGLDPYWQDICRLFLVFHVALKREDDAYEERVQICRTILEQMSNKGYDMFIKPRIEQLERKLKGE